VNSISSTESHKISINAAPTTTAAPPKPSNPVAKEWRLKKVRNEKCHWAGDRQGASKLYRRTHTATPVDPVTRLCKIPQTIVQPAAPSTTTTTPKK